MTLEPGRAHDAISTAFEHTGTKMSLSMRDADQRDGADLNPSMRLPGQLQPLDREGGGDLRSNPTRDRTADEALKRRREDDEDDAAAARPLKRLTSPEKFEAQQLIASGVLDVRDYPPPGATSGWCAPSPPRPSFWCSCPSP